MQSKLILSCFFILLIVSTTVSANEESMKLRMKEIEQRINNLERRSPDRNTEEDNDTKGRIKLIEERIGSINADTKNLRLAEKGAPPEYQLIKTISYPGLDPGQLLNPRGLAVSSKGIFVADFDNKRIQHFTKDGAYVNYFNNLSSNSIGKLKGPYSIALGYGDTVWVVDKENNLAIQYEINGTFITSFGGLGDDNGKLNEPSGIDIDNKGYIYVADSGNDRVQKFSPNGKHIVTIGGFGSGDYNFDKPVDVAVDNKGYIYVLDLGNKVIKKYNEYLQFMMEINGRPKKGRSWQKPVALETDDSGNIYVVDANGRRVFIYNSKGELIDEIYEGLREPHDIAIRENIYITDGIKHQIFVYKVRASH
ncbi:MAG: hypothetical protein A2X41_00350 [Candidatus Margulisbacteria bacterium GWE2_39_32]|nr:MAG: hypothetical protein A2X41_00350 [Candidatus Margulisbacteria bacterium GWE2_39_32]